MCPDTRQSLQPCRFCGRPLSAIEQVQGDSCRRLDCQRAQSTERQAAARAADLLARRTAAVRVLHDMRPLRAPVVQLLAHGTRLVPVRAAERREQIAHLSMLAAGVAVTSPPPAAPPAAAGPAGPAGPEGSALDGRVCAFCGGRCCRHGAFSHAFIDRNLLQRWVAGHPGSTLDDAAADYAARLPQEHVEKSCLHHGRAGCTLPREMRSDICNHHACDGLLAAQQRIADGAPDGLVVSMAAGDHVERAAWVSEAGSHTLTKRPRRPRRPRRPAA